MIAGVPLINGVEYTHADIVFMMSIGGPIVGITKLAYSDTQEVNLNHGTGQLPVSRSFGTMTPEGSVTLTMKEVQRLSAVAPFGRIQNIPDFDIRVTYITEEADYVSHRLIRCRFKGRGVDSSVGNTQIEETIDLSIADINYTA